MPLEIENGIRGLVFDLDGTLIDSYPAITTSVNHARRAFDMPALDPADVRRRVGQGLEHLMTDVLGADRAERGVELFREKYAQVYAEGTRAMPQARRVLEQLRLRGYRLSVASNKPARFGRAILDHLGMLESLSAVHGPDTAGATKPDPAMIRLCLRAMDLEAGESAYVGDMPLDVASAEAAGVGVVLVPGGSASASELRATGKPVLGGLADLLDALPGPGRESRRAAGGSP